MPPAPPQEAARPSADAQASITRENLSCRRGARRLGERSTAKLPDRVPPRVRFVQYVEVGSRTPAGRRNFGAVLQSQGCATLIAADACKRRGAAGSAACARAARGTWRAPRAWPAADPSAGALPVPVACQARAPPHLAADSAMSDQDELSVLKQQWDVSALPRLPPHCARRAADRLSLPGPSHPRPTPRPSQSIQNTAIKTSAACDDLIAFTNNHPEPFNPDFPPGDNPWQGQKQGGGGGCAIL